MKIRPAAAEDVELIVYFIKALAEAEAFPGAVTVTTHDIQNNLLSSKSNAEAVIFFETKNNQEVPCGFAVFYYTFSITTGQLGVHLDDLFIEPEYQGKGYGKQALAYIARQALEKNCARFEWWALKTNVSAIDFYQKIGANILDELSVFRLDRAKIETLAQHAI